MRNPILRRYTGLSPILMTALLAACNAETAEPAEDAAASYTATAIPAEWHGRYGVSSSDCKDGREGTHAFVNVTETAFKFFENTYDLVDVLSAEGNRLEATFDTLGPDGTVQVTYTVEYDDAQDALVFFHNGEKDLTYTRCPGA